MDTDNSDERPLSAYRLARQRLTRQINPWTRFARDLPSGTGSGFIWDGQGHIVTNFHVIQNASAARVTLNDHTAYPAALVGVSPDHDLAVLRIKAPGYQLRPVPLASSQDLQVGQKVFAMGNPFGLDQTLTTGVISALNRQIESAGGLPIEGVITNGCGDQSGQLRRSAAGQRRAPDRGQYRHFQPVRRFCRDRLCRARGHGQQEIKVTLE